MYAHKGRTNTTFVQRAKQSDGFVLLQTTKLCPGAPRFSIQLEGENRKNDK